MKTPAALDVVSLAQLAGEIGWNPKRLKRHLEKLNEELHGLVLRQEPPKPGCRQGGKTWVNRAALGYVQSGTRSLTSRIEDLEAFRASADARIGDLEAQVA